MNIYLDVFSLGTLNLVSSVASKQAHQSQVNAVG
jgi:hypothetical protein